MNVRPDEPTQLNMDPNTAASYWKQEVNSRAGMGYDIWGPAVTSSARGEQWMDNFLAACGGDCTVRPTLYFLVLYFDSLFS